MNLSEEEKKIGKDNYNNVLGATRRDFLLTLAGAGVVTGGGLGAAYFNYKTNLPSRLRVGIIGTGDEGNVLIGALNPEVVEVVAIADIRPYNIHRAFHGHFNVSARPGLMSVYGWKSQDEAEKQVKVYRDNYEDLIADKNVEAVIIALPLWLHHPAAIKAMRAGKHVLTEKLMAWNIAQCKEMARVADQTKLLLSTGHQRHYSVLYDNARDTVHRGVIGDVHAIQAQWHRGNLPGKDSWSPNIPQKPIGDEALKAGLAAAGKKGKEALQAYKEEYLLQYELMNWKADLAKKVNEKSITASDQAKVEAKIAEKEKQIEDWQVDAAKHGYVGTTSPTGYQRSALEELIRWRLWNRTGGGLMAELGSHQLDASGIFISSQFDGHQKVNPLCVSGVGVRSLFPDDREVDDHVHCAYEYPGKGYFEDNNPTTGKVADPNKKVVVSYSSINGNGFGGYGETVLGTNGTLLLLNEQETLLYAGAKTSTSVTVDKGNALVDSYETGGGVAVGVAQEVAKAPSRGYQEEIEHWAWCIREGEPAETLHCYPKVALADAVIALTSNIAMRDQKRINFDPKWFDWKDNATPDGSKPRAAADVTAQRTHRVAGAHGAAALSSGEWPAAVR